MSIISQEPSPPPPQSLAGPCSVTCNTPGRYHVARTSSSFVVFLKHPFINKVFPSIKMKKQIFPVSTPPSHFPYPDLFLNLVILSYDFLHIYFLSDPSLSLAHQQVRFLRARACPPWHLMCPRPYSTAWVTALNLQKLGEETSKLPCVLLATTSHCAETRCCLAPPTPTPLTPA